jgi:hypothetical protein
MKKGATQREAALGEIARKSFSTNRNYFCQVRFL